MLPCLSVTASEELHLALKQRSRAILPLFYWWLNWRGSAGAGVPLKFRFRSIRLSINQLDDYVEKSRIWFDAWLALSLHPRSNIWGDFFELIYRKPRSRGAFAAPRLPPSPANCLIMRVG